MAAVCLYFQVHQPRRLRHYSVFDTAPDYFDDARNAEILRNVAERCYLPVAAILQETLGAEGPAVRLALSFSGVTLEALERWAPDALAALRALVATGQVELLGETSHHSLAALYSPEEFAAQAKRHGALLEKHFAVTPRVFRNTELIVDNNVITQVQRLGFAALLGEGWQSAAGAGQSRGGRGEAGVGTVRTAAAAPLKLLLRNYALSDDIAFRFTRTDWSEWPLTAEKFAARVTALAPGPLCNLFMDLETFGEHQKAESGIFEFLGALPRALLAAGHTFQTPSEAVAAADDEVPKPARRHGGKAGTGAAKSAHAAAELVDLPRAISWADEARDLSAWLGNAMQTSAAKELYKLEAAVKKRGDEALLEDWRNLTTSDHIYYMSTKRAADGQVHAHFSPYESPYDAYINFMNVLDHLRTRTRGKC
jgi:alpha-amylase